MRGVPSQPARREVLTIVGPTAVGKTAVAVAVAGELRGEIISADSRQIYRGMDTGTAKPTSEELALVPHHLIGIVDPGETYDAARFSADAERSIADVLARGAEPMVVGGTGFYIASLFRGLFEGPGRDEEVRAGLERRARTEGIGSLHEELKVVDPVSASRIHPNDKARVIRALEVHTSSGRTLSEWHGDDSREPLYEGRYFGLTMPRDSLYERIDRRVDSMIAAGLLHEIEELVSEGVLSPDMPGATAVGYRELLPIVMGREENLDDAVALIKRNTRRYAKRQLTWFSSIEGLRWIDVSSEGQDGAVEAILSAL